MSEPPFLLAVIVVAHRDPEQLASLLRLLEHPRLRVYLHLDKQADEAMFGSAITRAGEMRQTWLPRRRSRWGGVEIVDAVLDGLRQGLQDGCSYFMLISGQDVPLRSAAELVEFAVAAGDTSYIEYFPLPTGRWMLGGRDRTEFYNFSFLGRRVTCVPRGEDTSRFVSGRKQEILNSLLRLLPPRRAPAYVEPFGGATWWNLSLVAARHVMGFVADHPGYRRYHARTFMPDEIFFQTAIMGCRDGPPGRVVNDDLRYIDWSNGGAHPRMLTMADLNDIVASNALFARKISQADEPVLYERLAGRLAQ